jgi:hypothetical protein
MTAILSVMIFAGAFATSVAVVAAMVVPQWRRIASLAAGNVEADFTPLRALAIAERRIAVRRWASASAPVLVSRTRAVA